MWLEEAWKTGMKKKLETKRGQEQIERKEVMEVAMSVPRKAYHFLVVQVHLEQRLATSSTLNLTFSEVTS